MDINSLLKFNFDSQKFASRGKYLISNETEKKIEIANKSFNEILSKHSIFSEEKPFDVSIIYKKFIYLANINYPKLSNEFNTRRKVKKLAWILSYKEKYSQSIIDSDYFDYFIRLLENYFTYSCLKPLISSLLENWFCNKQANVEKLREFIYSYLYKYSGKRQSIIDIKENSKYYLSSLGIELLIKDIKFKNINLDDLLNYMKLPEYMKRYSYFSEFITFYTRYSFFPNVINLNLRLKKIIKFLYNHDSKDTSKKCIAKIIPEIEKNRNFFNNDVFEDIKTFAFKHIGDPSNNSYWQIWKGANEADKTELKNAQTILNNWITEQFIEIFFETLSMDINRKLFWKKYLKHIKNFKIFGNENLRSLLSQNIRINEYLKYKFGDLYRASDLSAFMMQINNYILVEFSYTGNALYGYEISNSHCPDISSNSFYLYELKNQYRDIWLTHSGDWEYRFSDRISQILDN